MGERQPLFCLLYGWQGVICVAVQAIFSQAVVSDLSYSGIKTTYAGMLAVSCIGIVKAKRINGRLSP